ncbi:MAG: radical SAM family heme chaperone HemW [Bacteroidota bacterium]|nr:radical SAM family heme chaperone HemW [Bacteroidota bacterium]
MASLYIHIPFCHHKCIYCDFYSIAQKFDHSKYIDALEREMEHRKDFFEKKETLSSVYFGGGTPSILSIKDLGRIFEKIVFYFSLSKDCEITFEANPENISFPYARDLRQIGFNRISLGVQSFDDKTLRLINRSHTSALAKSSIEILKNSEFENISIDLISNLPYSDLEHWKKNLEIFLSYDLPHISCYTLMREEGTMLDKLLKKNKLTLLEESQQIEQMEFTMDFMQKYNYAHYETSSFALEGFHSRHNMSYWTFEKYLGLGAGAHSYNGKERFWNIADVYKYTENVLNTNFDSICEKEFLSTKNKYNEYIMLTARLSKGLSLEFVKKHFAEYYVYFFQQTTKLIKEGLINKDLSPTRKGWLLQDSIILALAV